MLGRNVGRLEKCTGLKNTGVLEDEGQYLQDVYPLASKCGGDGRFGFDPKMHLTDTSGLLTPENISRLERSWDPFWDKSKTIRVEKTPANLLMTRFLQAAFPNSCFVIVRRHPVPVGLATQKWKINVTSLYNMFDHWLRCHELFDEDKTYLERLYELSYEDYVENPNKYHQEIAAFIGTRVPDPPKEDQFRTVAQWRSYTGLLVSERAMEEVSGAHNKKYFDRWSNLLAHSTFKSYYRYIARRYESRFAKYGYSLTKDLGVDNEVLGEGKFSNTVGVFCCLVADVGAFFRRLETRIGEHIKQLIKALLPEFVRTKISQMRRRDALNRERARALSH